MFYEEEIDDDFPLKNTKRFITRENKYKYKKHLKKLSECGKCYHRGSYLVTEKYIKDVGYVELDKPYFKRIYGKRCSKYFKNVGNKKVRKYRCPMSRHSDYRKVYNYWCVLY